MFSAGIKSTCPVCDRNIDGTLYEEEGRILMKKSCSEHGETLDLISGDAELFQEKYALVEDDGDASCKCSVKRCLGGICGSHAEQQTSIAFVDITTRCNMKCPVCFADAEAGGKDFPLQGIGHIIDHIRDKEDIHMLILIGGEPTLHKDLIPILEKIKEAGLRSRTCISTNGISSADMEFCKRLHAMGFRWYALGFDGTTEEIYKTTRGTVKGYHAVRKTIENLRQLDRSEVILNVTAMKGVNDHDLPNIVRFGLENSDVVKRFLITLGTFCGRDSRPEDLLKQRLTLEDIEHRLREATGSRTCSFSASVVNFFAKPFELLGLKSLFGDSFPRHENPLCDNFAYVGMTRDGKMVSIMDAFLKHPEHIYRHAKRFSNFSKRIEKSRNRFLSLLGKNRFGRAVWKALAIPYYVPQMLFCVLAMIRPGVFAHVLASLLTFRPKRYLKRKFCLEKAVRLWIIPCADKFNFSWNKTRYCGQHYYLAHHQTGKVVKIAACAYLPFHDEFMEIYQGHIPARKAPAVR